MPGKRDGSPYDKNYTSALARAYKLVEAPPDTLAGIVMRAVHGALMDQIGENATAAQKMVIQMAAIKITRCQLWQRKMLDEDQSQTVDDQVRWLAWSNSAVRDLVALGLKEVAVENTIDLASYLAAKKKTEMPRA